MYSHGIPSKFIIYRIVKLSFDAIRRFFNEDRLSNSWKLYYFKVGEKPDFFKLVLLYDNEPSEKVSGNSKSK